ncbi:MAG TPA: hypothetical protein VN457_08105, partial [Chlamydiales bacterium]|nr:hypothetical protein [Chlamydiales bacterium]
ISTTQIAAASRKGPAAAVVSVTRAQPNSTNIKADATGKRAVLGNRSAESASVIIVFEDTAVQAAGAPNVASVDAIAQQVAFDKYLKALYANVVFKTMASLMTPNERVELDHHIKTLASNALAHAHDEAADKVSHLLKLVLWAVDKARKEVPYQDALAGLFRQSLRNELIEKHKVSEQEYSQAADHAMSAFASSCSTIVDANFGPNRRTGTHNERCACAFFDLEKAAETFVKACTPTTELMRQALAALKASFSDVITAIETGNPKDFSRKKMAAQAQSAAAPIVPPISVPPSPPATVAIESSSASSFSATTETKPVATAKATVASVAETPSTTEGKAEKPTPSAASSNKKRKGPSREMRNLGVTENTVLYTPRQRIQKTRV